MKIVTWNCNGALRNKIDIADGLDADILIIQECENPALSTEAYRAWAGRYLWIGNNKNKGMGIFPKKGHEVKNLDWFGTYSMAGLLSKSSSTNWQTTDLELFLPFSINQSIEVLGVWTKGQDEAVFGYVGQFWKYLQIHHRELSKNNVLIMGDFNSNKKWDKPDRWWSHTGVVNELEELGIVSLYHLQSKELQGEETQPTFYLQRKEEKPYHIDYIFGPREILDNSQLTIGVRSEWIGVSDHMPLSIMLNNNR
jgi:exodeoxyribonuclease-3